MKLLKVTGIFIAVTILLAVVFIKFTQSDLKVIRAEYASGYSSVYPPECFIQNENKRYLITNIDIYQQKFLRECWSVGSEGFAIKKLIPLHWSEYSDDQKIVLNYNQSDSKIEYNGSEYNISRQKDDSVFSKITTNKIIIFIRK